MTIEIYLSNVLVASKVCNITDIGDSDSLSHACGSVSITYTERTNYRDYNGHPSWQQSYTEIDTPAKGYQLVRCVLKYTGSGSGTPPDDDETFRFPFVYPNHRTNTYLTEYFNVRHPEGTWTATVRLYFTKVPRTPTHLLVNSSTVESPAKLVYDPATNLLVTDY